MSLPTSDTPVLAAAVTYVEAGHAVVPVYGVTSSGACMCGSRACKAVGKHPVGKEWQKRGASTVDEARDLFANHDGNLGIYLGGSGNVVLDFDGEPGLRIRDSLIAEGILPPTLTARSGSGGEHRVYAFASWQSQSAVTDRKVGLGWDVKRSGQFLVAPSRHACGGAYEWTDESPITVLPDALYDRIRKVAHVASPPSTRPPADSRDVLVRRARAYVERMPAAISGSGGHAATFAVARKLLQDFALGEGDAWDLLVEYNARCQPPWTDAELRHKLSDAAKAHTSNPIQDRPRPPRAAFDGGAAVAFDSEPQTSTRSAEGDWRRELLWTESNGKAKLVIHVENVVLVLQLHPLWRGLLRYDEFRGRVVVCGSPPWSEYHRPRTVETQWTDEDASRLEAWLRREFHVFAFAPTVSMVERAVDVVARANSFNPVREYLTSLAWDGVKRVEGMAAAYFGAEDTAYARNVMRWWMISAVARVFDPGCKADHVLIFEGPQGLGKSTALEILASQAWFTDSAIDLNSKDAFERVRGRWIVELAELDALFRAEASRAKQFFSSRRDDYRPAYGRREREQLRQCVFAGTVNLDVYLNDPTGARRFWPLLCVLINHAALRRDRDQLWAEAVALYHAGESWWPSAEAAEAVFEAQAERTSEDEWTDPIRSFLRGVNEETTVAAIMQRALTLDPKDWTRPNQTRVGSIMRRMSGWLKKRRREDGELQWVYLRAERNPDRAPYQRG